LYKTYGGVELIVINYGDMDYGGTEQRLAIQWAKFAISKCANVGITEFSLKDRKVIKR